MKDNSPSIRRLAALVPLALASAGSHAADVTPAAQVPPPTDAASAEALDLTEQGSSLRWLGLDFFPRATAGVRYDNNIFIQPVNPQRDVIWNLSPALAVTAGDIALYLPQSVSLSQLRNMLAYGLGDEESRPQRYLGIEYQPDFNFYTDHSSNNYINQNALFAAGYRFSRLSLELNQDYQYGTIKDSYVGELVTSIDYLTRLKSRYQVTEKTYLEVNGRYENQHYVESNLSGFQEVRGDGWFNRQVTPHLVLGAGAAFGYLAPQAYFDQPYEQLLVRGMLAASEKLAAQASAGVEWRQFDGNQPNAVNPTFSVAGIYQPSPRTALTLEIHRRELPSPSTPQNYTYIGVSAGVRQSLFSRLTVGVSGGYDNVSFDASTAVSYPQRTDNLVSAALDVSYEIRSHWTASFYYNYTRDNSNIPTYSYGNSVVGLRLGWRY